MITLSSHDRTQTGVRLSTPLLKVLKGLAEYQDMSLGDLLEGIVLHAFEGKPPFSDDTQTVIRKLCDVYGCDWTSADSHQHPDPQHPDPQHPDPQHPDPQHPDPTES